MTPPNTDETPAPPLPARFVTAWQHLFQNHTALDAAWVPSWLHRADTFHPDQDFTPERDWLGILDHLKYGNARATLPRLREIADRRPNWYECRWHLVRAYLILGESSTAEQVCRDWLTGAQGAMESDDRVRLSVVYRTRGEATQAWAAVSPLADRIAGLSDTQLRDFGDIPAGCVDIFLQCVGAALAGVDRAQEADVWYQRAEQFGLGRYNSACVASLRGQTDQAIQLLETHVRYGEFVFPEWLAIDPDFAAIRHDPRFVELVTRVIETARKNRPRDPVRP